MNIRTFLSSSLIFGLVISLLPMQNHPKDPDLKKILLYGGACIAGIGVLNVAQNKPRSGLTLVTIGTGMVGIAKPAQVQSIFDKLMGRTQAEKALNWGEHNFKAIYNWFPKV